MTTNSKNSSSKNSLTARPKLHLGLLAIISGFLILIGSIYVLLSHAATGTVLLSDNFNAYPDGIITSEYTHWNPGAVDAKPSTVWDMTSGTLYAQGQTAWTGNPDDCSGGTADPNAASSNCNNSSVFRLNTKQAYSGDIQIDLSLRQNTDIHDANCNANDTCWHGTHIWARYQSQFNLYYASVNRADGQVVLKRKVPCGSDNSGTYFVLGNYVPNNWSVGQWNKYSLTVQDNADGSVTLKLYDVNKSATTPVTTGTDKGGTNPNWSSGCTTAGKYPSSAYTPLRGSGQVGVRGDYANFNFDDFTVSQLTTTTTTTTVLPSSPPPTTTVLPSSPPPTADTTAPSAPSGLTGSGLSSSQISLRWTASTDNVGVTQYQIFRNGVLVGTSTTTAYVDSGLSARTTYSYYVKAVDAAGNVSAASNTSVSATKRR